MFIRRTLPQTFAAITLATLGAASQATIAVAPQTTSASFAAASAGGIDSYSDLTINTDLGSAAIDRRAGAFGYRVSANSSDLFVVPVGGTIGLSTTVNTDSLTFAGFNRAVYAIGGNFYGTSVLGEVVSGGLTVLVTDINGLSASRTLAGGTAGGFVGFTSTVPFASLVASITTPNTSVYASADNLVLGVPEPSSWLLMLAGGAVVLRTAARRRG
jgi:hypothetical protein